MQDGKGEVWSVVRITGEGDFSLKYLIVRLNYFYVKYLWVETENLAGLSGIRDKVASTDCLVLELIQHQSKCFELGSLLLQPVDMEMGEGNQQQAEQTKNAM